MAMKNSVYDDFRSLLVDSIDVFDCRLFIEYTKYVAKMLLGIIYIFHVSVEKKKFLHLIGGNRKRS